MEEPPRIEHIVSSRGISISDTASILQAFLATLDNNHVAPQDRGEAMNVTSSNDHNNWNTPRKSRQEKEEESILKQFDLISKQFESRLVSDDTYERLKLIRDSLVGESTGRPVLPSEVVKSTQRDDAETNNGDGAHNDNTESQEIIDGTQQFIAELYEAEQDLDGQITRELEEGERRREAKKAKKEKKAAKKARKEAKKERREKRKAESASGDGGGKKRVKIEE
ncbi:hypothetical protein HJC23_003401 [Cyclotella cryptica]|uniref:Uncharacterized protein n=1 Tax=Cyclotella cryptica TaxID=29204 RepID=A0ABD3QVQ3_9STRA|eukprot:CCRYP_002536-RA/>CCRYP_002536-RA protein AED:0.39 eAED:0.39 QI:0/-1/0/1/-1/1/1/0/223